MAVTLASDLKGQMTFEVETISLSTGHDRGNKLIYCSFTKQHLVETTHHHGNVRLMELVENRILSPVRLFLSSTAGL